MSVTRVVKVAPEKLVVPGVMLARPAAVKVPGTLKALTTCAVPKFAVSAASPRIAVSAAPVPRLRKPVKAPT